jgi:hypothetical protein
MSLSTRKEVTAWLMPKMVFFMPTIAAVTTTAGYFLASKMGLITLSPPVIYWIATVLVIVSVMFVHVLGFYCLQIFAYIRDEKDTDMKRVQRLMKSYVKVVAIQATLQFIIIFIMAEFAIGFFLNQ